MYKLRALPIILLLLTTLSWADTPVVIRRVCENGRDNHIFFTPSSDPCALYFQYKVWGRDGNAGPFVLIDSILTKNQDNYIHVEASPGIATNWSYYIVITDSCGPDYETYSDTIIVDRTAPIRTFLDSVSIDPITNEPYLGWPRNVSPDFSYFKVYWINGTNNTLISSQIDTFYNDNAIVSGPKTFNISSVDSCGNETPFNDGQHTSMFLSGSADTCLKLNRLTWTPYIGWSGIRIYYLYIEINGGGYQLLDSVIPPQTTYNHPIVLGNTYRYYIRAFRDPDNMSASSNSIGLSSRFRQEPINSYLSSVSVLKPLDPTTEIHLYNPNEEVSSYTLQVSESLTGNYTNIGTISGANSLVQNYTAQFPFVANQKYFRAIARNACDLIVDTVDAARYSSITATPVGNTNQLNWEHYFFWNTGVDYYNLYRGTNDASGNIVFSLLDIIPNTDTQYIDLNLPLTVGENGLCYYVEAVQAPGDVNASIETALSTTVCVVGSLSVFVPNAFNPNGVNTTFRPEGSYIDYDQSQMEIYDRWGQQLIKLNGIRKGWDGKDSNGVTCMQGVYLYRLFILSTNGQQQTFKGTVTLLN